MYALYLHHQRSEFLTIGSLGTHRFQDGHYLYIGSAQGPGGIRARVNRHLRPDGEKRQHWHIDTLMSRVRILEVWWWIGSPSIECDWAESFQEIGARSPARFGASDCRCPGHLIYLGDTRPEFVNHDFEKDVTRVSIDK
jgi:Uri superfamily endonuclease